MKRPLFALLALAACSSSTYVDVDQVVRACNGGAQHAELTVTGSVERLLGERRSQSGEHEGFVLSTGGCNAARRPCPAAHLRVEVNTSITGEVPLTAGQIVTVRGQYECNDGVIHWTHHDPSGRHMAGFIDVNGTRYQ